MIHLLTTYTGDEIIVLGVFEGPTKTNFEYELRMWLSYQKPDVTLRKFLDSIGFKELEYESHAVHQFRGLDE